VLQGLRNTLGGATSIAVAAVAGSVLVERNALGDGYAATFLLAFALTSVGLCALLFVREPEPPAVREPSNALARIRELPELLREDRHFTRYFACRALGTMGRMAVPFYILYAGTRLEITGTALGHLTVALLFAQTAGNLGWGWIADRAGFRLVFIASLVVWIFAALLLLLSTGSATLLAVFAGLGAGQGGFQMAGQNMVLEFGVREDLPMRIAVVNTGTELVGAIGPLLGGIIAATWSYPAVLWLATGCQALAVATMLLFVAEPRPSELRRW